jgi:hypothetical protein
VLGFALLHPTYGNFDEIWGILIEKPLLDSCNIVVPDRRELPISLRLLHASDNQFSMMRSRWMCCGQRFGM